MLGSDPCSRQVAAVERVDPFVSQPLGDGLRLRDAERRQRAVGLALAAAFQVPERFAVADEDEVSLGHVPNRSASNASAYGSASQVLRDLPVSVQDALIEAVAARVQIALML